MKSNTVIIILCALLLNACAQSELKSQSETEESNSYSVQIDTSYVNAFENTPNANFKLDYYHTDGYSTYDRYYYEIIIIDSLLILNFKCPANYDWNFIYYQKQIILDKNALNSIMKSIKEYGITQKVKGIPKPMGSGYGADRLFIESEDLSLSAGAVYMAVGNESSEEEYNKHVHDEIQASSTIGGDFQLLFDKLKGLFPDLTFLLESKEKND